MKHKDEIIALFKAKKSGNRGWYLGDCGFCGKEEHMGLIFGKTNSSFVCKKCGQSGDIYHLLKQVGRLDLNDKKLKLKLGVKLEKKLNPKEEDVIIDYKTPSKLPPMGYKKLVSDFYLLSRDFTPEQFEIFGIGETKIHPKLREDYIIFLIKNEGEIKGYLGRSRKSKKEIDLINKSREKHNKYLRWINSPDTAFNKLLFGFDEITENTTTVILVEGLTSKANVDRKLNLYKSEEIKCCATFGKKLSPEQIQKLIDKGVNNIILLYDPDAINESKKYSLELFLKKINIEVGYIPFKNEKGEDKDPGDLSLDELLYILERLEKPLIFSKSKVQKKKLL